MTLRAKAALELAITVALGVVMLGSTLAFIAAQARSHKQVRTELQAVNNRVDASVLEHRLIESEISQVKRRLPR